MIDKILVIPGYKGSPNGHWQTWLQTQYPNTERIKEIDHHKPILSQWSAQIQQYLEQQTLPIIIIAHSFGCLAALDAIVRKQLQSKVSGVLFVAPASPYRFTSYGHRADFPNERSIVETLTIRALGVLGTMVVSRNDPWMNYDHACSLASDLGLLTYDAGYVGHINIESGHGPWPEVKALIDDIQLQVQRNVNSFK